MVKARVSYPDSGLCQKENICQIRMIKQRLVTYTCVWLVHDFISAVAITKYKRLNTADQYINTHNKRHSTVPPTAMSESEGYRL